MFSNSSISKIASVFVAVNRVKFEQVSPSILVFEFGEMPNKHQYQVIVTKFKDTYSLGLYLVDENYDFVETFKKIYEYYSNLDELCNRIQSFIDICQLNCNI